MLHRALIKAVVCGVAVGVAFVHACPPRNLQSTRTGSGVVPENATPAERREVASKLFTSPANGRLARTMVNRIWQRLFDYGLVEPVDEMDNQPWNPDLLDWLASDFAEHGYDLNETWVLKYDNFTPLYYCCRLSKASATELAILLVDLGAKPNLWDDDDETVLHYAFRNDAR